MAGPIESIEDDDWLYRRHAPHHIKPDGTVSSTAFMRNSDPKGRKKEPDPDISVDLARLTTPERSLQVANRPTFGIGALQAMLPRHTLMLEVVHDPTPENRAHSSIRGNQREGAEGKCRVMAEEMTRRILIWPRQTR